LTIYDEVYSSPNYGYPKGSFGRRGHKISGIGLHITGAAWQSNYSWIMNPAANASYNAVIKDDGTVVSLVPEGCAAYSHGKINRPTWPLLRAGVNPNLDTLSLARTGSNQNSWTPGQLASTLKVLRHWSALYDIPLKRPYIFGHFEIDSVDRWYCPGRLFFDQVLAGLAKGPAAKEEQPAKPPGSADESSAYGAPDPGEAAAVWYRVVAGSYRDRANAEQQLEKLRAAGIRAFIMPGLVD